MSSTLPEAFTQNAIGVPTIVVRTKACLIDDNNGLMSTVPYGANIGYMAYSQGKRPRGGVGGTHSASSVRLLIFITLISSYLFSTRRKYALHTLFQTHFDRDCIVFPAGGTAGAKSQSYETASMQKRGAEAWEHDPKHDPSGPRMLARMSPRPPFPFLYYRFFLHQGAYADADHYRT